MLREKGLFKRFCSEFRTGRSNGELAAAILVTILSLIAMYFLIRWPMYN